MAATKRRGRKRMTGRREPNGRRSRAELGPVIPAAALERRAEVVGEEMALDQRAGTVLGRLWLTQRLTWREYEAGERLGALWRRWAVMAQCPARHPRATGSDTGRGEAEVDAEAWERARATMDAIEARVRGVPHWRLAWSVLETVCVDDLMPPRLESPWPIGWAALRDGLRAVADHYRLPADPAAGELAA